MAEANDEATLLRTVGLTEGNEVDVDLISAIIDIAEDLEMEYLAIQASVTSPEMLVMRAHPVLPRSIAGLLDSVVVHFDCDNPEVCVGVRQPGEVVRATATDNDPGIPDAGREALLSSSEASLSHASGAGLWLVRATADASGGSLDTSALRSHEIVVTVSFPRPA